MDTSKYIFTLERSQIDPRDFMLETIYPQIVELPEVWDLRPQMQPIRDQGNQGTCSAQTAAAMKEWQESADVQFKEHMSPWFVYKLRTNQESSGMTPRDTMEILYKIGIVPETDYIYLNNKPITEELKQKAGKYKIQGYAQINTLDALKKALFANGPTYCAFPVYNSQRMDFWKPDYTGQEMKGGHAVTCCGWTKDSFIIRNSWSSEWGFDGYCFYNFSDFGCHWELWTAIDADSNSTELNKKLEILNTKNKKGLFRKLFACKIKK